MKTEKTRNKKAFDAPRDTAFLFDPDDLLIVGLDTKDGTEHPLYDERIRLPLEDNDVKNVDVMGILQPILITKIAGQAYVVDGRQRVRWAREAKKLQIKRGDSATIRVPARNKTGSDVRLMAMMTSTNEVRRDDDVLVKADKAQRLLDRGASIEEVGVFFSKHTKTIENWLVVASATPKVKKAVVDGKITPTAAGKIAKLEGKQAQEEALHEVLADVASGTKSTIAAKRVSAQKASNGKSNGIGLGRRAQSRLLEIALGGEQDDRDPYWDGVADALRAVRGETTEVDAKLKVVLKKVEKEKEKKEKAEAS
jgi:ParB family chromosome partitioning protein